MGVTMSGVPPEVWHATPPAPSHHRRSPAEWSPGLLATIGGRRRSNIYEVQHGATVLFEELARKDFREDIGRVLFGRDVLHGHHAGPTQLAHLEHLAVDMARMLCGRESVTEVVGPFVVRSNRDRAVTAKPDMGQHAVDVDELDRGLRQRHAAGAVCGPRRRRRRAG